MPPWFTERGTRANSKEQQSAGEERTGSKRRSCAVLETRHGRSHKGGCVGAWVRACVAAAGGLVLCRQGGTGLPAPSAPGALVQQARPSCNLASARAGASAGPRRAQRSRAHSRASGSRHSHLGRLRARQVQSSAGFDGERPREQWLPTDGASSRGACRGTLSSNADNRPARRGN